MHNLNNVVDECYICCRVPSTGGDADLSHSTTTSAQLNRGSIPSIPAS